MGKSLFLGGSAGFLCFLALALWDQSIIDVPLLGALIVAACFLLLIACLPALMKILLIVAAISTASTLTYLYLSGAGQTPDDASAGQTLPTYGPPSDKDLLTIDIRERQATDTAD